ncbi:MAG: hypothetical protein RSC99_06370 [Clostridiales bacterium]
MKSKWKVNANFIGGNIVYAVYRQIDVDAVNHSGNQEFATDYMENKSDAKDIAQKLNDKEMLVDGQNR